MAIQRQPEITVGVIGFDEQHYTIASRAGELLVARDTQLIGSKPGLTSAQERIIEFVSKRVGASFFPPIRNEIEGYDPAGFEHDAFHHETGIVPYLDTTAGYGVLWRVQKDRHTFGDEEAAPLTFGSKDENSNMRLHPALPEELTSSIARHDAKDIATLPDMDWKFARSGELIIEGRTLPLNDEVTELLNILMYIGEGSYGWTPMSGINRRIHPGNKLQGEPFKGFMTRVNLIFDAVNQLVPLVLINNNESEERRNARTLYCLNKVTSWQPLTNHTSGKGLINAADLNEFKFSQLLFKNPDGLKVFNKTRNE